jgi:hypothetical protein
MQTLTQLNTLLTQFQEHAAELGFSLAVYAMGVMLSPDKSAAVLRNKWDSLTTVLICAGIIAGSLTAVHVAHTIFGSLKAA